MSIKPADDHGSESWPNEDEPLIEHAFLCLGNILAEIADDLKRKADIFDDGEDEDGEGNDGEKRHGTKSGNKIGRKRYDVPFAIVCKALRDCCGNYSAAARRIFEETGIKVSPGFVQIRVQREDKTLEDILGQPSQSLAPKSEQK